MVYDIRAVRFDVDLVSVKQSQQVHVNGYKVMVEDLYKVCKRGVAPQGDGGHRRIKAGGKVPCRHYAE